MASYMVNVPDPSDFHRLAGWFSCLLITYGLFYYFYLVTYDERGVETYAELSDNSIPNQIKK
jgi:hypothetical protein